MGACYTARLSIKFKDGRRDKAAIRLRRLIENTGTVDYGVDRYEKEGVLLTGGIEDLMRIFLAGRKKSPFRAMTYPDGVETYENDFNASYGWERVMINMFKALAPYLVDGSTMEIYPDSGCDRFIVRGGKAL